MKFFHAQQKPLYSAQHNWSIGYTSYNMEDGSCGRGQKCHILTVGLRRPEYVSPKWCTWSSKQVVPPWLVLLESQLCNSQPSIIQMQSEHICESPYIPSCTDSAVIYLDQHIGLRIPSVFKRSFYITITGMQRGEMRGNCWAGIGSNQFNLDLSYHNLIPPTRALYSVQAWAGIKWHFSVNF